MRAVSWAPNRPGLVETSRVAWREVKNADLTPELDVPSWFSNELVQADLSDSVAMLTSRNLARHHFAEHLAGGVTAQCLATVGLGNAERVGRRVAASPSGLGTINLLAVLSAGLSPAALLEALTIAAEARTAAIVEVEHEIPTGVATGTGTDCIVVAAPTGETDAAGKHTDIGEALGGAVYDAVSRGAREWTKENA